jgi:ubiquinone biosynthesis protein COQ4
MIKRYIQKLKFLKAFLAVVRDPTRTDLIFKIITDPRTVNKDSLDIVTAKLCESSKCKELIQTRYAKSWDLDELLKLPPDTFGYGYAKHMRDNGLDINFYPTIPGETEEAYIQMRSRQTHDIWHVLTGFDTSVPGEVGLQAFVQAQMYARSPSTIMSMFILHCAFYKPSLIFATTQALARGWSMGAAARPLFGEKFEETWGKNLTEYRKELNLYPIPS